MSLPSLEDYPTSDRRIAGVSILAVMRKHTRVSLDRDQVGAAAAILGTSTIVGTVHAALAQVVERDKRSWLARYPLSDLSPEALNVQRRVSRPE